MTYGTAAELKQQKFRVCNSHDHMNTLHMAIPDAEIVAVQFSLSVVTEQYMLQ